MSNEEKLRCALVRMVDSADYNDQDYQYAKQVLRETAPAQAKHPAEVAWEEKTPESERSAWNKNTFLAGYKAGLMAAVTIVYGDGTKAELRQAANEVPTQ